jgi:peptidoglycan/LPS O-acetylase OafA/YrhL
MRSIPAIDGLRGLASLFVLVAHLVAMLGWPRPQLEHESPFFWAIGLMDMFFCVSGFLIGRGLLRSSAQPDKPWVKKFLVGRALRIYPAYYFSVLAAVFCSLVVPLPNTPHDMRWNQDWGYLGKTVLFLQNTEFYFGASRPSPGAIPTFQHSWSVALEEQFYLLLVLVMFLRASSGFLRGSWLLIGSVLLLPLGQLVRHYLPMEWVMLGRCDGFLLGVAFACVEPKMMAWKERSTFLKRYPGWLGTIALPASLLPTIPYLLSHAQPDTLPRILRVGPFEPSFAFSMVTIVFVATCMVDEKCIWLRPLDNRVLNYMGKISYSVYLLHPIALYISWSAIQHWHLDTRWLFLFGIAGIYLIGSLSFHFIEAPFMRIKVRKSAPLPAMAPAPPAE